MHWQNVGLGYVSYLAIVSMTKREFASARAPLVIVAVAAWAAQVVATISGRGSASLVYRNALAAFLGGPTLDIVVPALTLLTGYWLSGLLFVRPDGRIERWLQSVDERVLTRPGVLAWFRRSPRAVQEFFELSYLLVYIAVPAGAATLAVSGHADQINRFWTVVLLAEFACYGMLPWIQTRPPRVLETVPESLGPPSLGAVALSVEAAGGPTRGVIKRLNRRIVDRASIQANTIPSGHAAGALATALVVLSIMPLAGVVFLLLATSIAAATVLGRYHYVVDTVLGVLVALAAWSVLA